MEGQPRSYRRRDIFIGLIVGFFLAQLADNIYVNRFAQIVSVEIYEKTSKISFELPDKKGASMAESMKEEEAEIGQNDTVGPQQQSQDEDNGDGDDDDSENDNNDNQDDDNGNDQDQGNDDDNIDSDDQDEDERSTETQDAVEQSESIQNEPGTEEQASQVQIEEVSTKKKRKSKGKKTKNAAQSEVQAPAPQQVTSQTTPTTSSRFLVPIMDESEDYVHEYTLEDYDHLEPRVPTTKWLRQCATEVQRDSTLTNKFNPLLSKYRLGDCVRLCRTCTQPLGHANIGYDYFSTGVCPKKKDQSENFVYEYDLDILDNVLNAFQQKHHPEWTKPADDEVVIHLRLGDSIDKANMGPGEFLVRGGSSVHDKSKTDEERMAQGIRVPSFYHYLEDLDSVNAQKISLVGGSHFKSQYRASKPYAYCLQRGLARAGKQVKMSLDNPNKPGDADHDFYYMSYAKRIMRAAGGFSQLVVEMAQKHGGEEVGKGFRPFSRINDAPY